MLCKCRRFAAIRADSLNRGDSWPVANNFALKNACMLCKCRRFVTVRGHSLISDTNAVDSWRFAAVRGYSLIRGDSWPFDKKNFAHTYHPLAHTWIGLMLQSPTGAI